MKLFIYFKSSTVSHVFLNFACFLQVPPTKFIIRTAQPLESISRQRNERQRVLQRTQTQVKLKIKWRKTNKIITTNTEKHFSIYAMTGIVRGAMQCNVHCQCHASKTTTVNTYYMYQSIPISCWLLFCSFLHILWFVSFGFVTFNIHHVHHATKLIVNKELTNSLLV